MPLSPNSTPRSIGNSVVQTAASAAPAADTTLIDSGALAVGTWHVEVTTYQLGTPDSNRRNMTVVTDGPGIGTILSTSLPTTVTLTVTFSASDHIYVKSGGSAAGAGSVYCASLVCTRLT